MTLTSKFVKLVAFVAFGLALSGIAWANGEEFFHPDETGFDLYYFGHIKDKAGKVLDNVVITIKAKNLGMNFPVRNDAPGHFRSPDIGKAIKGLGKKVDPAQLEIVVSKAGYRQVQPSKTAAPNKAEGAIQIEFVMEPVVPATEVVKK